MPSARAAFPHAGTSLAPAESACSAVSWGAVIAGAFIAAAVSAMLLTAGAGLGFLSVSPWRAEGVTASSLAAGSIICLLLTQIIAYGAAGYVTGRLRTRWTDAISDEIYFRDTAHGFLVWALSAVLGLALLGPTMSSVVLGTANAGAALTSVGVSAATAVAGRTAQANADELSLDYFADALLRPDDPSRAVWQGNAREEVARVLARSVVQGEFSEPDRSYLVKLIAKRAEVGEATAQQRLTEFSDQAERVARRAEQKARAAADVARKAAAGFSLWAFASLLIGAFVASYAATIGGRARDR